MMFYDKDGLPISMQTWASLLESDYKIVKQEVCANGNWVSTMWLGLNHSFDTKSLRIFETMVFKTKDSSDILETYRYPTLRAAIAGHNDTVSSINARPTHYLRKLDI